MIFFTTIHHLDKWHYLNSKNIRKYLSAYPYLQNGNYYAVCFYCHNPIRLVGRLNAKTNEVTYYGVHSKKLIPGFSVFDQTKLSHCLYKNNPSTFVLDPLKQKSLDVNQVNLDSLRKDLTYYTGFYFSKKLTYSFLLRNQKAFEYRDVDQYNFPFVLLLVAKSVSLNYRKVANPRLKYAIDNNADYFQVSSSSQIVPLFKNADLIMSFEEQELAKNQLPLLHVRIYEILDGTKNLICESHIFAKMFNNLIDKERTEI